MKKIQLLSCLALAVSCLAAASHHDLEELMKANGKAYTAIEKGIAKEKFDGLQDKAQHIADQAVLLSKDFEPPIKQDEIEKFRALALQLNADALSLKEILATEDAAASKTQLRQLEQTCKTCHNTFIPKKKKK